MRKSAFAMIVTVGASLLLLCTVPAVAIDAPLYIGYELPKNPDLAGDALALESKCLNARDTVDQACSNGANQSECLLHAEISFRRCIASIPGAKFWLAGKTSPTVNNVDQLFPLTADEAIDPDLNPVMDQLRSANRYYLTGLYAQLEKESCTLRKSSDSREAFYRNGHLCQALQDYFFYRQGLPVMAFQDIPLLVAISRNQSSLVWDILERGGLAKSSSSAAAESANKIKSPEEWRAMIRLLVDHGLDVNTILPVIGRSTILNTAVSRNDLTMVRYLFDKGADASKGTPLSAAVAQGNQDMVKLLLKNGADVHELKGTPLALAAAKGNVGLVKLLVANGANINSFPAFSFMMPNGSPALVEAVKGNHLSVAKWLLENGASVDIADRLEPGRESTPPNRSFAYYEVNVMGWPAMVYAIQGGHLEMVKLLISHKAYIGGKGTRISGPVWWAVKSGNTDIVKYLIAHGANVNECSNYAGMCNPTPLQEAAMNGNLDIAKLLLKHGADVNGEGDEIGATPVWVAQTCHHPDVAEYLKKKGGAWGIRLNFDPNNFRCN